MVVGVKRVRDEHINLFDEFYQERERPFLEFPPEDTRETPQAEVQLVKWKTLDSMPMHVCIELKPEFRIWREAKRRWAEIIKPPRHPAPAMEKNSKKSLLTPANTAKKQKKAKI
jgi:hypothetical protein